jgi:hypothetical protein
MKESDSKSAHSLQHPSSCAMQGTGGTGLAAIPTHSRKPWFAQSSLRRIAQCLGKKPHPARCARGCVHAPCGNSGCWERRGWHQGGKRCAVDQCGADSSYCRNKPHFGLGGGCQMLALAVRLSSQAQWPIWIWDVEFVDLAPTEDWLLR